MSATRGLTKRTYCWVEIWVEFFDALSAVSRKQKFASFAKNTPRTTPWRLVFLAPKERHDTAFPQDEWFGTAMRVAFIEVASRVLLWASATVAGRNVITRDNAGGNNQNIVYLRHKMTRASEFFGETLCSRRVGLRWKSFSITN